MNFDKIKYFGMLEVCGVILKSVGAFFDHMKNVFDQHFESLKLSFRWSPLVLYCGHKAHWKLEICLICEKFEKSAS